MMSGPLPCSSIFQNYLLLYTMSFLQSLPQNPPRDFHFKSFFSDSVFRRTLFCSPQRVRCSIPVVQLSKALIQQVTLTPFYCVAENSMNFQFFPSLSLCVEQKFVPKRCCIGLLVSQVFQGTVQP